MPEPADRDRDAAADWRSYVAIGCVACATLIYQVAITRVLSVILWYHFAFLAVSLAMLGLGAPGVWFALRPPGPRALTYALRTAAVAVPMSLVIMFRFGGDLDRAGKGTFTGFGSMFPPGVLLVIACILFATISLGSAVCLFLIEARGKKLGRVYGADLIGATIGALLVVPLLWVVKTPLLIAGCGLLPIAADLVVGRGRRAIAGGLGVVLLAALIWGEPFALHYAKEYKEDTSKILFERWTPTAKITVWNQPFQGARAWGWGYGKDYQPGDLHQYWIEQDGSAGTPITELTGEPKDLTHLFHDVTAFGYELRPPRTACVIGAGGGRDVLTALAAGATDVDAVELNAGIVDAVSDQFGAFSGHVYQRPGVHAFAREGRAHLTRTEKRYDLLQISLIDSWAATAAGAFALSENHLYTVEAFRLYYQRLSPTGMLSVSRWHGGRRYLEAVRLALLAREALRAEGVDHPEQHLIIMKGGWVANLVMSKTAFTEGDLARAKQIAADRGFTFDWPTTPAASPVARALIEGPEFLTRRGFVLTPPTDDKPFFFQTVGFFGGVKGDDQVAASLSPNEHSVFLLRWLVIVVSIATVALFFAPFLVGRRRKRGAAGFWRGSGYFASIGIGFMLVEAGWIQRFILFLGHPSYATTVVIAALLLGAGVGSFVAARTPLARVQKWALILAVVLAVVNTVLSPLLEAALGLGFPLRVAISLVLLIPPGFLMGFAFPTGMARFGDDDKAWFWAVNGATSVLASVGSLALAMTIGFQRVVFAGALCYIAAAVLLRGKPPGTRDGDSGDQSATSTHTA